MSSYTVLDLAFLGFKVNWKREDESYSRTKLKLEQIHLRGRFKFCLVLFVRECRLGISTLIQDLLQRPVR